MNDRDKDGEPIAAVPFGSSIEDLHSFYAYTILNGAGRLEIEGNTALSITTVINDPTRYGFVTINVVPFGDTIPVSDACLQYNAQQCLSGNFAPVANCQYNYGTQKCTTGVSPDVCQASTTQSACATNSCFWDQYTNSCFASLAQVNSIYGCNIWSSAIAPDGSNPACAFHGCAYDSPSRSCADVTQEGATTGKFVRF